MRRSRVLFVGLVAVTLLCSVIPYVRLYFGRHNSLWDDAAYLVLLSSLVLLYRRDFLRFVRSRGNPLLGLAAAVSLLFLIDLSLNAPLNLYKTKMYVLVCAMYVLSFLFTKLRADRKTRFVGYLLLTWLAVSVVELYLRWTTPALFGVFPWNGMPLQSATRPLVTGGYISVVESKAYGLGIGSQANVIALMSLLVALIRGGFAGMPALFRMRKVRVLIFLVASVTLPFTLSLSGVIAFVLALTVVALKRAARFTVAATFCLTSIAGGAVGLFAFNIGSAFGFSANTATRDAYLRELVFWPLEFFRDNATLISLGLHNDIAAAPLENRYFNVVLALGVPLSLYIALSLFRLFRALLKRSGEQRIGTLKLTLFVLLCVSYFHISFASHVPGLILFASLFVFVAEPVRSWTMHPSGGPVRAPLVPEVAPRLPVVGPGLASRPVVGGAAQS